MQKRNKYLIIGVLLAVVAVGTVALATNTEIFQGRLALKRTATVKDVYYFYNNKPVSIVASRVPSVVVSGVTSTVGTSEVISGVESVVASSVASGVPLKAEEHKKISNIKILPKLTSEVLVDFAKQDFVKNPAKYRMSETEKERVLKMYEGYINAKKREYEMLNTVKLDALSSDPELRAIR